MQLTSALTYRKRSPSPKTEIEVFIQKIEPNYLTVRLEEDAKDIVIPKRGVTMKITKGRFATLTLTESRAITYGLV